MARIVVADWRASWERNRKCVVALRLGQPQERDIDQHDQPAVQAPTLVDQRQAAQQPAAALRVLALAAGRSRAAAQRGPGQQRRTVATAAKAAEQAVRRLALQRRPAALPLALCRQVGDRHAAFGVEQQRRIRPVVQAVAQPAPVGRRRRAGVPLHSGAPAMERLDLLRLERLQPVAHAIDGGQQEAVGRLQVEFLPKSRNVGVERSRRRLGVEAPDRLAQVVARQQAAQVAEQEQRQRVLAAAEFDQSAGDPKGARRRIEAIVAETRARSLAGPGRCGAAGRARGPGARPPGWAWS